MDALERLTVLKYQLLVIRYNSLKNLCIKLGIDLTTDSIKVRMNREITVNSVHTINDECDRPRDELGQFAKTYEPFPSKKTMNSREVISFLESQGFKKVRRGKEPTWQHPELNGFVQVPKHGGKDIRTGTLTSIKNQYKRAIGSPK